MYAFLPISPLTRLEMMICMIVVIATCARLVIRDMTGKYVWDFHQLHLPRQFVDALENPDDNRWQYRAGAPPEKSSDASVDGIVWTPSASSIVAAVPLITPSSSIASSSAPSTDSPPTSVATTPINATAGGERKSTSDGDAAVVDTLAVPRDIKPGHRKMESKINVARGRPTAFLPQPDLDLMSQMMLFINEAFDEKELLAVPERRHLRPRAAPSPSSSSTTSSSSTNPTTVTAATAAAATSPSPVSSSSSSQSLSSWRNVVATSLAASSTSSMSNAMASHSSGIPGPGQTASPFDQCRAVLSRLYMDMRYPGKTGLTLLEDSQRLRRSLKLLDTNSW
jgi:hypothetical protein